MDTVNFPPNPNQQFYGLYSANDGLELTIKSPMRSGQVVVRADTQEEASAIAAFIYEALKQMPQPPKDVRDAYVKKSIEAQWTRRTA